MVYGVFVNLVIPLFRFEDQLSYAVDDCVDDGQFLMRYYLLGELQQGEEESFEGHLDFYLGLCGVEGVGLRGSSLDESGLRDAVLGGPVAEGDAVPVLVVGPAEAQFAGFDEFSPEHLALLPRLV